MVEWLTSGLFWFEFGREENSLGASKKKIKGMARKQWLTG